MSFNKLIISILCLFSGVKAEAQNLVPNPGFELMNDCNFAGYPIEGGISDWFTYNYMQNTVDVLHTCLPYPQLQPPNTIRGYSYPHNGNGMIGLAYAQEINYREIVSVKLNQQLIKDSAYCVGFWVKNSKMHNNQYWVEYVGLLFTEDTITPFDIHNINPDVKSTEDLSTHDWIEVNGYYIATGSEKYANIGYFGPSIAKYQSIPYVPGEDIAPFYFYDDVSVVMCNKDSLLSVILELPNVLTIDNNNINEVYLIKQNNIKKLDMQILNRWGNVVRTYDGVNTVWDGTDNEGRQLVPGVYFVKAIAETTFGDIIQKTQFVTIVRW